MKRAVLVTRDKQNIGEDYRKWLSELKKRYRQSQIKAAIKVNSELLRFYWSLGRDIVTKQAESTWGSGFLKSLSVDLQHEFPESKGLSYSNLKYARQWYLFYYEQVVQQGKASSEFGQQVVGELEMPELFSQLGWGHHIVILSKMTQLLNGDFVGFKALSVLLNTKTS